MPDAGAPRTPQASEDRIPRRDEVDPVAVFLDGEYPRPPSDGGGAATVDAATGRTGAAADGTGGDPQAAALSEVEQDLIHLYHGMGMTPAGVVAALARHDLNVTVDQIREALAT